MTKTIPIRYDGYIEGYYGRLLSFDDRKRIVRQLKSLGLTSYFYAPKDDSFHRFNWRQPYPDFWLNEWQDFAADAADKGITVIAGLAPGLDLDMRSDTDMAIMAAKLKRLCGNANGNVIPCLLMDDIPPAMADADANDTHIKEGQSHADLANRLARQLAPDHSTMMVTPRVYADELEHDTPGYLGGFAAEYNPDIRLFYCGQYIVSHDLDMTKTAICQAGIDARNIIIWDNLYANDYCPRRLFLGAWDASSWDSGSWDGRSDAAHKTSGVMLNPTGMIETDLVLLNIMAANNTIGDSLGDTITAWQKVLQQHGVPDAFFEVAHVFDRPVHPSLANDEMPDTNTETMLAALDELLWRWKSPLAREWYPYLMGLRGDLLMLSGAADDLRQAKIMPPYLRYLYQNKKGKAKGKPTR